MIKDLKTEIENLAGPILEQEGYDLVEVKLSRFRNKYRLQVFTDSDTGVTLGQCAHLSRLLGSALDVADLFESPYILEVSSPGLDRHLHSERDFRRRIGKEVRIEYHVDGKLKTVRGQLALVEADRIRLSGEDGDMEIPLTHINYGKIVI